MGLADDASALRPHRLAPQAPPVLATVEKDLDKEFSSPANVPEGLVVSPLEVYEPASDEDRKVEAGIRML